MVRKPFTQKQCLSIAGAQEVMMGGEESSTRFKAKILKIVKDLTNRGKHKEASELFNKYFGDDNGKNRFT